jgi:hypothetical protein
MTEAHSFSVPGERGDGAAPPALLPSRWWMLLPLMVRLGLALFLCAQANHLKGFDHFRFYDEAADTPYYLQPIENLLQIGSYVAFPDQPLTRAGRMPGYGATYLVFRIFSSPPTAKTLLVCLQVLVSGLSAYYFALTALRLLRRRSAFFIGLTLYTTALFVVDWDYRLLTESLAASSVIFFFYELVRYGDQRRRRHLLRAGFWFAYLVFLRPFAAPLALATLPFLWPRGARGRQALARMVADLAIVVALFAVADLAWIVRNQRIFGRIIPTQVTGTAGYNYSPAQLAQFAWLQALGQNLAPLPQNLAAWFRPRIGFAHDRFVLPAYVLTTRCSRTDIERARDRWDVAIYDPHPALAEPADREVTEILTRCRESFRQERPLQYYLLSPLRLARAFFIHSGPTLSLPPFSTIVRRPLLLALKLFAAGSYIVILVSGLIGLGLVVRRRSWLVLSAATPFFLVALLFPFVLRAPELRYLVTGYPGLCLLAVVALQALLVRMRERSFRPAT